MPKLGMNSPAGTLVKQIKSKKSFFTVDRAGEGVVIPGKFPQGQLNMALYTPFSVSAKLV